MGVMLPDKGSPLLWRPGQRHLKAGSSFRPPSPPGPGPTSAFFWFLFFPPFRSCSAGADWLRQSPAPSLSPPTLDLTGAGAWPQRTLGRPPLAGCARKPCTVPEVPGVWRPPRPFPFEALGQGDTSAAHAPSPRNASCGARQADCACAVDTGR